MQTSIAGFVLAANIALAAGAVAAEAASASASASARQTIAKPAAKPAVPPAATAATAAKPAAAKSAQARPAPASTTTAPLYIPDAVIKQAINDVLHAEGAPVSALKSGPDIYSGDPTSARMTAAFNEARVPDCLHDNALKHQPAKIGPIGVVGPLSLPWVTAAMVRGKCSMP